MEGILHHLRPLESWSRALGTGSMVSGSSHSSPTHASIKLSVGNLEAVGLVGATQQLPEYYLSGPRRDERGCGVRHRSCVSNLSWSH